MGFDTKKMETIKQSLNRIGALTPCARCANKEHHVFDEYYNLPISQNAYELKETVPLIATMCINCGNFNFHAVSVILPSEMI